MTTRAKVTLTPEQETLLITLYAKAQPGNPLLFDPTSQDILNRVDYDFARLRVPYKTIVLICQRAKKLDIVTRGFLHEHPAAWCCNWAAVWTAVSFEWTTAGSTGTTWTCHR